jgi:hypothetical protein
MLGSVVAYEVEDDSGGEDGDVENPAVVANRSIEILIEVNYFL